MAKICPHDEKRAKLLEIIRRFIEQEILVIRAEMTNQESGARRILH